MNTQSQNSKINFMNIKTNKMPSINSNYNPGNKKKSL